MELLRFLTNFGTKFEKSDILKEGCLIFQYKTERLLLSNLVYSKSEAQIVEKIVANKIEVCSYFPFRVF